MSGRIAVCSWSLRPESPEILGDRVAEAGLSAVQLALGPLLEEPVIWSDAVASLAARGIRIVSGMMALPGEDYSTLESIARTGGLRPDDRWPDHLSYATRIADIAGAIGLELVTFHAGFLPEDPEDSERRKLIDRLHLVVDAFERHGVAVALETGQETAATLGELLETMGRSQLGVNFDPANMILYDKGDPIESIRGLARYVRQVHIKDARRTDTPGTWGREMPVGAGEVNWPAFLAEVAKLRRDVDLVIEREARVLRMDDVRTAAALLMEEGAAT